MNKLLKLSIIPFLLLSCGSAFASLSASAFYNGNDGLAKFLIKNKASQTIWVSVCDGSTNLSVNKIKKNQSKNISEYNTDNTSISFYIFTSSPSSSTRCTSSSAITSAGPLTPHDNAVQYKDSSGTPTLTLEDAAGDSDYHYNCALFNNKTSSAVYFKLSSIGKCTHVNSKNNSYGTACLKVGGNGHITTAADFSTAQTVSVYSDSSCSTLLTTLSDYYLPYNQLNITD